MPRTTRQVAPAASPSRHVTFADEQGNAVAAAAATKKEIEKQKKAEERARVQAQKRAEREEQAAVKRAQKEEARRRKEEERRVAEMEAELARLRREKHVAELEKETQRRQAEEEQNEERRARITTAELLGETDFVREPYSPKTLEQMKRDKEQKNGPYDYSVSACLRVETGSRIRHMWANKIGGLFTKGSFDSHLLNIEIDKAMADKGVSEIADISGWVKSAYHKATRQHFNLKDLGIDEWEARVETITTEQWKKYCGYVLDVSLTLTGRAGVTRSIQEVDGPTQSPSRRRTRTDALEESHAVVRDRNESLGNNSEKLITRWKCHDSTCGHKGCCWIDDNGEHHRLNSVQRERWASAITSGKTTEYEPPYLVIKSLMGRSQEGEDGKSGKKKSAMEQMKEMMAQQMEFDTIRSMKSIISEGRQQPIQQSAVQPWLPPPVYSYPPSHPPSYQPSSHDRPYLPTPNQRSRSTPSAAIAQGPLGRSSPIGEPDDDDDILEAFWQWKKARTDRHDRKLQYCQIQAKITYEGWGIDDVKSMEDTSSHVYTKSIDAGLPDGIIRRLKGELSQFKKLWRDEYQYARGLAVMGGGQQQGGGQHAGGEQGGGF